MVVTQSPFCEKTLKNHKHELGFIQANVKYPEVEPEMEIALKLASTQR